MSTALSDAARRLVGLQPVFDAHVDSIQRALDLGHDLGRETAGHLDLVRGARGGLGSVVLVAWVDPVHLPDGARARTLALLGASHELARRHPERLSLVRDGAELAAARAAGRIAGIPGIEGGHSIEGSLEHLREFYGLGVRVMTLVWNNHLPWIRSCQDGAGPDVPAGLSPFGRDVVREMNALGMLVDLSHAGERSFYDALEVSTAPVIASHSGCKALHDHPRNLTDDQLRALRDRDGVVGIVFHPGFLDADARAEENRVRGLEAYRALEADNDTALFLAQSEFIEREAAPLSWEHVLDHIVHVAEVAGVAHVGIGSDFDGIQRGPAGLEGPSCYGTLADGMLGRGFSESEVLDVLGRNMERAFARATASGA